MPLARLVASSPESIGVDAAAMAALFARVEQEVSEGRVQGCQVAVCRHGRLAGCASFGTTQAGSVTNDTLFCCFSSTKATGAVAAWQLLEAGLLDLDEKVADIIPEFASHGKDAVTVRQLVTFTGGFPAPADNLVDPLFHTSVGRCAEFAKWELAWEPGSRWEYHADSAHWVLMEIVERRTGMDFRDYLRTKILDPSGLSGFWVGVPREIQPSLHFADVVSIPDEDFPGPGNDVDWSAPEIRALGLPAGGGLVTAADLALFYQPLLNGGKVFGGGQILKPQSIAHGLTVLTDERHTFEVGEAVSTGPSGAPDQREPLRIAKLRGVIMELAGDDGDVTLADGRTVPKNVFRQVGVGAKASGRSFGHGGAGGQIAWGDPESGISFAFVHNTFGPEAHPGKLLRDMVISDLASACALRVAKL